MRYGRVNSQSGALLIEVLVTIAIVVFGVMSLLQVQSRLQKSEVESYQRSQALILLNDMANKIAANRGTADTYVTSSLSPAFIGGTDSDWSCASDFDTSTRQGADFSEWCSSLQGSAEDIGGKDVGGVTAGRGCVENFGTSEYLVTVVWQGLTPAGKPPPSVLCGQNLYDESGTDCDGDVCRRYVTARVRTAALD